MSQNITLAFVCVGPQRTGTTWLHKALQQHPKLCLPSVVKETMFFDRRYERGIDWYYSYFEPEICKACGEVAPTYFDVPEVPSRIHKVSPKCKIIINVRHPAERAFSLYLHHLKKGRVSESFRKAVEEKPRIISAGQYAKHIPRWKSKFGPENVHIILFSDIKNSPNHVLNRICEWVGVGVLQNYSSANEKVNASKMPRFSLIAQGASSLASFLHTQGLHRVVELGKRVGLKRIIYTDREDEMPKLSQENRLWIIQKYEEDIKFVESEVGQKLPSWRK
ncbi:sulfotransferase family protein [Salinibacter ruber]|uniref:sulfotransferase family protein n=1 Tax=Salinibacter ruber TaxID=146919 RepID=UPI00216917DE|nr:sulfotransferase [Salinibacter ruber]MCS4142401.1 hypothetical protein [Salinibacter ruber]